MDNNEFVTDYAYNYDYNYDYNYNYKEILLTIFILLTFGIVIFLFVYKIPSTYNNNIQSSISPLIPIQSASKLKSPSPDLPWDNSNLYCEQSKQSIDKINIDKNTLPYNPPMILY